MKSTMHAEAFVISLHLFGRSFATPKCEVGAKSVSSLRSWRLGCFSKRRFPPDRLGMLCKKSWTPPPAILELLKLDTAIEQAAAIDVTTAQRNVEQPWWRQGAIRADDGKRHGHAVISPNPRDRHRVRHIVVGYGSHLSGLEIDA
jgi:hypothetical protein